MTVKLSSKINGWLHGRVSNASATLTTDADGSTRFEVTAKPVIVPMVGLFSKKSELTSELNSYYTNLPKPLNQGFKTPARFPFLYIFNAVRVEYLSARALWSLYE